MTVSSPVLPVDVLHLALDSADADAVVQFAVGHVVSEWLTLFDGVGRYGLVMVLAAIPLLEILVVVPPGIALGLNPVGVAVAAFVGNVLPVYAIVVGHDRLAAWWNRRDDDRSPTNRRRRSVRIWNRYGLPGLAALAPVVTGVHLAAVIAVGLGARTGETMFWMTASIAAWTVVIAVASVAGLSLVV